MFFMNKRTKQDDKLAIINEKPNERAREVDAELKNENAYESNDDGVSTSSILRLTIQNVFHISDLTSDPAHRYNSRSDFECAFVTMNV